MSARVLFYVQHLLGVGHLKRAEILAEAMARSGLEVTVALGGRRLAETSFQGVRIAELPAAAIAGEDFSALVDASGQPVDAAWKASRTAELLSLYRGLNPDVVLIELYPFGRRQFRFELLPLIEEIHAGKSRPRLVCSVRDILVASRTPGRDEETAEIVRRWFDAVLVHGDPALIPFGATFAAAERIADLIVYTGYVAADAVFDNSSNGQDEVIVSAGGGAVGGPLLFAALDARPATPLRDRIWRFLTGPNLPEGDFSRLSAASGDRVIVERYRADFAALLSSCALSISQAGYNTTMDILRAGARAVVIPYETRGETEQMRRSAILAEKGLLTVVPVADLSPGNLAAAISAALTKPRRMEAAIDLSGAARTTQIVADLARRRAVAIDSA